MNEIIEREAQQIWQSQPVEGTTMSVEAIRQRATKFERKVSRRNLGESVAAVFVIVCFAYFFATMHDVLFRITWALFMAGMIWVVVQLYRKGTPRTIPADMGSSTSLEFFRTELKRQRDLAVDIWTWYLIPLLPGYVAYNVAHALMFCRPLSLAGLGLLDVFFAATFIGVWQLNVRAARCLQRMIDELPAVENPR